MTEGTNVLVPGCRRRLAYSRRKLVWKLESSRIIDERSAQLEMENVRHLGADVGKQASSGDLGYQALQTPYA